MIILAKSKKSSGVLHRAWGAVPPYNLIDGAVHIEVNGTHIAP